RKHFFFQAEDGIRDFHVTGVQTCALPIFSHSVFNVMSIFYLAGFVLFAAGIMTSQFLLLKTGAVLLIAAAALYNWNVFKVITHRSEERRVGKEYKSRRCASSEQKKNYNNR